MPEIILSQNPKERARFQELDVGGMIILKLI
jgi:hypothetical protein